MENNISFNDFHYSEEQLENYKRHLGAALISEYIKINGAEPADVAPFFAFSEEQVNAFKALMFSNKVAEETTITPPLSGPEMVDLGLPSGLKWAKCNVGAEKESDYGLYFKLGEVAGHTSEELSHFDESIPSVEVDSNNHLLPAYDAATQIMGEGYRMPTAEEIDELINNTSQKVAEINGVNGTKFISKVDASKYIFIPFAGYCSCGGVYEVGRYGWGYLWGSTIREPYSNGVKLYVFNWKDGSNYGYDSRNCGFSVRGVSK